MIIKKSMIFLCFVFLGINTISDFKDKTIFLLPFIYTQIVLIFIFPNYYVNGLMFLFLIMSLYSMGFPVGEKIAIADLVGIFVVLLKIKREELIYFTVYINVITVLFFLFNKKKVPLVGFLHLFSMAMIINMAKQTLL